MRLTSRLTATNWQTVAKAIEHAVNSVPIGYYLHQTGASNPLLRILSPNTLKLVSTSDRAPAGLFTIPDGPQDIMEAISSTYELWYQVFNEHYLPLLLDRQKWHFASENLVPNDIVYFKLRESEMSSLWVVGKVEEVDVGRDGFVREATISYRDTSSDDPQDWAHRTVSRPIRNMCKLFNIDDTCFMDTLNDVFKLAEKVLSSDDISHLEPTDADDSISRPFPNIGEDVPVMSPVPIDDVLEPVQSKKKSTRRKRKTEVENLEIKMKNWNFINMFQSLSQPMAQEDDTSVLFGFEHCDSQEENQGNEIDLNSDFGDAYMI